MREVISCKRYVWKVKEVRRNRKGDEGKGNVVRDIMEGGKGKEKMH